ncbi:adhesin [Pseudoalteromonas sp. S1727]|uniref:Lcl C-terminal domain-containing protein n=1 Tax=Pseudoalteromonas sp. S1727 TaxID=2066514 RepID=UPI001109AA84|nr:DUF1566 domain-containing protein [Pseudoalteromonas sp. S1727]TMN74454.1 adhesin [Pseudoalteromonas sp. S1727]
MKHQLIAGLLFLSPMAVTGQTCYESIADTTPTTRFTQHTDGTVSDSVTGLMWQTCSYGQSYDVTTDSCLNSVVKVNWQEALRAAVNDRTGAYKDWQVPNNKELASILEHSCVTPSINEEVFLGSLSENYWTSTSAIADKTAAWVYTFDRGLNSLHDKEAFIYLRLVRYEK